MIRIIAIDQSDCQIFIIRGNKNDSMTNRKEIIGHNAIAIKSKKVKNHFFININTRLCVMLTLVLECGALMEEDKGSGTQEVNT